MLLNATGYVCAVGAIALCASALLAGPVRAADDPFEVTVIPSNGRTVTAELADVDGDGRTDLLQAVTFGMPPDESRVLRVYPQRPDGSIAQKPEIEVPIPPASAAYDVADVNGVPGVEFLLLRARGSAMISFSRSPEGKLASEVREARIPEDLTIGVADD